MEAAPDKISALWSLASHLKNHPRRTKHAGPNRRIRDELISDVFLWGFTHGYQYLPTRKIISPVRILDAV